MWRGNKRQYQWNRKLRFYFYLLFLSFFLPLSCKLFFFFLPCLGEDKRDLTFSGSICRVHHSPSSGIELSLCVIRDDPVLDSLLKRKKQKKEGLKTTHCCLPPLPPLFLLFYSVVSTTRLTPVNPFSPSPSISQAHQILPSTPTALAAAPSSITFVPNCHPTKPTHPPSPCCPDPSTLNSTQLR